VAEPDCSRARKKAWSRNGLSVLPDVEGTSEFQVAAEMEAVVG